MSLRSEDKERRKRERIAHEAALKAQHEQTPRAAALELSRVDSESETRLRLAAIYALLDIADAIRGK